MEFDPTTVLPPPSEARISWFERSYRVRLPASLRHLFATGNGGVPRRRTFDQSGRERLIERFLPLLDDPRSVGELGVYDVTVVLTQVGDRLIEDDDLIGSDVVPIAALFAGDLVCLSYRNPDLAEPTVVVWDHEQSDEGRPHLHQVAATLAEFLSLLR